MIPGQTTISVPSLRSEEDRARLESGLRGTPGVFDASASVETRQVVITYDASMLPEHALFSAVEAAGFKPEE